MERNLWGGRLLTGTPVVLSHCPAHILDLVLAFLALPSVSGYSLGILWTRRHHTHTDSRGPEKKAHPLYHSLSLLSRVWFLTSSSIQDFQETWKASIWPKERHVCWPAWVMRPTVKSRKEEQEGRRKGITGNLLFSEGKYWKPVIFNTQPRWSESCQESRLLKTGLFLLLPVQFISLHVTFLVFWRIKSNAGLVQGQGLPQPPLSGGWRLSPSPSQLLRSILLLASQTTPHPRWKGLERASLVPSLHHFCPQPSLTIWIKSSENSNCSENEWKSSLFGTHPFHSQF